jgi:hypothetical protein
MKYIALTISILVMFCSCSTKGEKKVRVIEVVQNIFDHTLYNTVDSSIHTMYVDTIYRTGDIVSDGSADYKIVN